MNKEEMDIQLIEACVLEKWNPKAMGCGVEGREWENCCLCQVYQIRGFCYGCPVQKKTGYQVCLGTPITRLFEYSWIEEGIEAEIEFLISLLPENHPWSTQ